MQQSFLYRTGDILLPPFIIKYLDSYIIGSNKSLFYINYWSILHFLSGIIVTNFTKNWIYAILLHTIWEFWQIFIGMTQWKSKRGFVDIITDTIFFMSGFLLFISLNTQKENNKIQEETE
jgi:hypothetical protein